MGIETPNMKAENAIFPPCAVQLSERVPGRMELDEGLEGKDLLELVREMGKILERCGNNLVKTYFSGQFGHGLKILQRMSDMEEFGRVYDYAEKLGEMVLRRFEMDPSGNKDVFLNPIGVIARTTAQKAFLSDNPCKRGKATELFMLGAFFTPKDRLGLAAIRNCVTPVRLAEGLKTEREKIKGEYQPANGKYPFSPSGGEEVGAKTAEAATSPSSWPLKNANTTSFRQRNAQERALDALRRTGRASIDSGPR